MVAYVVLANFTEQGIRNAKEFTEARGSLQGNGEDVRSNGERNRLDTGAI